ncbi:MAG: hypothetical protein RR382_00460 [Tannerellaceae bacterium]
MITFERSNWWCQGPSVKAENHVIFQNIGKILGEPLVEIDGGDAQPDLVLSGGFGLYPVKRKGVKVLFIQLENPRYFVGHTNVYKYPQVGYVDDDEFSCEIGDWHSRFDQLLHPRHQGGDRIPRACAMWNNVNSERYELKHTYNAILTKAKDKIDDIARFDFNIAAENSYAPCYITEKLADACIAGCIPIYKGGDLDRTPFNQQRIIPARNDKPARLPQGAEKQRLMDMPMLATQAQEMYEERTYKIKKFLERVLS